MNILSNNKDLILKGMFLFIFIISGNYIGELLGCRLIELLEDDMIIKHILGFITLYITLAITINNEESLFELFFINIILYIVFILTSKTTKYINFTLMFLFLITFVVQLFKEQLKKKIENKKHTHKDIRFINIINIYNTCIIYIIIILIIIGIIIYLGEQKLGHKEDFNYYTFIVGRTECDFSNKDINSKDLGSPSNYIKSIKAAIFNEGL